MSALKLTFPANLPKNEKDLICMLLAGRLKDLLNGRLVCAQLAIDDLIKDTTGISALGTLRDSLVGMRSAVNSLKAATGYDNILRGVNQALGQVNNVFSLGGLCPSPVRAPMIPDLLGQLNANLFGQGLNILNALGKISNPSMCLGGGPGGFGINWNSMPGDLKNLKAAIKQAGNTPSATINAFNQNLKAQTSRLKSEVKRLEQNLSDPLGLNNKLNTARNLTRAKSISDGYPVKDSRGILHDNVLKTMVSADIESVIDNGDKTPIKYITKPVLDYCGDVVGYEKVAITGDSAYIGWDPNGDPSLNTDNPTVNPVAGFVSFKYTFKQEGNAVNVYDNTGTKVSDLILSRGIAYRLNFELIDKSIKLYYDSAYTTVWTEGLTYSRNPEYGNDMEIITPDSTTTFVRGELDWAVLIENPTTPDIVYWKTNDSLYSGSFIVSGETSIPLEDRTYDISMAVKKAYLHLVNVPATPAIPINYENFLGSPTTFSTSRTYNTVTKRYNDLGNVIETTSLPSVPFTVKEDIETSDELGNTDPNNKIIKSVARFNASSYLITKRYVSVENGLEYNQLYFYISPSINEVDAIYCILLKFNDPITILSSSKLPYTDNYSYKLSRLTKSGTEFIPVSTPISNSDETKFELVQANGKEFIRWNLTSYSETDKLNVPKNEFIFQTDIEIDPTDIKRTFIDSNPKEYRTYFYFKFGDGTAIDSTITLTNTLASTYTVTPASTSVTEGSSLTFNVGGTNIVNGTYYWTVTNSEDFVTNSGSFTITNNLGSFSVIPSSDSSTEGAKTFTASIRSGSISGVILETSSSVTINDASSGGSTGGGTGGGGYYNGVELIASGTNPTYWVYPVPTDRVYPTSATRTTSETFIGTGQTPVISITYTLENGAVALEPMELNIVDHSRHFNAWDTVSMEPGASSVTWTRPSETLTYPGIIEVGALGLVSKYYDPRLGPPRRIPLPTGEVTYRISSKPIVYDQTIDCSLVAGKTFEEIPVSPGIPATHTEGTATYDILYYADGSPYYVYHGGCNFKTYYTKKISGPNAGVCTPAYFTQQGMPPPSSSLDPGELVYDSRDNCLASGGTLPNGIIDPTADGNGALDGGGGTGYHKGVKLIPSGVNPIYWYYPLLTPQSDRHEYPYAASQWDSYSTVESRFINIGETKELNFTWSFNNGNLALEPMQMIIEDRQALSGPVTSIINIGAGGLLWNWTKPAHYYDGPQRFSIIVHPVVPRFYDPRLGPPPHSIGGYDLEMVFDVSSKPVLRDQTIACSLIAGNSQIQVDNPVPATHTEGTATYDVLYHENGDPYYIYRGGCRPP